MECRELTERAIALLTGEIGEPERRDLQEHRAACAACREELARIEETWANLGAYPDAEVSPELRRRTLALMEDEMTRQRIRVFTPSPRPARFWPRMALQAAALLLAAGAGWIAHRPASPRATAPLAAVSASRPVHGTLSNVAYRLADEQGKVAVSFDETSRRTVVGRPEDPAVASLLAYLVSRGAQTSGEKSQAIELLSSTHSGAGVRAVSPEIVRALSSTLKRDPNPGVRKKAADALAGFPLTPEIRSARWLPRPSRRPISARSSRCARRRPIRPRTVSSGPRPPRR
jgi:hypothetical protein